MLFILLEADKINQLLLYTITTKKIPALGKGRRNTTFVISDITTSVIVKTIVYH